MIIDTHNFDMACAKYDGADFSGKSYAELVGVLGDDPIDEDETAIMVAAVEEILAHRKSIVYKAAKICGAADDFSGDSGDVKI